MGAVTCPDIRHKWIPSFDHQVHVVEEEVIIEEVLVVQVEEQIFLSIVAQSVRNR